MILLNVMDASVWIDLVIARSLELRRAGILAIGCEGFSAELAPLPFAEVTDEKVATAAEQYDGDPLHDPATYAGGVVPGFEITKYTHYEAPDEE